MTLADAIAITKPDDAHARAGRYVQASMRLAGRSDGSIRLFKRTGELRWLKQATYQTAAAMRLLRWAKEHIRL